MPEIAKADYGTPIQVNADTLIMGRIDCSDGGRGYLSCRVIDAGTTVRYARASAHQYTPHDCHIRFNSLTMLVRANQSFIVEAVETFPSIDTAFWREPL